MEIEIIKDTKNQIEFILKGERYTFPNLLKSKLLEDKDVEFVAFKLEHPMDKDSKFVLKTKEKTARKALSDASKTIMEELGEFKKALKKAVK
ncbi:MAG: DNA-directed RNA polymerase subunit L [Candidatus Diapherotrites archaeon]